jgi:hypothetical protein
MLNSIGHTNFLQDNTSRPYIVGFSNYLGNTFDLPFWYSSNTARIIALRSSSCDMTAGDQLLHPIYERVVLHNARCAFRRKLDNISGNTGILAQGRHAPEMDAEPCSAIAAASDSVQGSEVPPRRFRGRWFLAGSP